MKKALSFILMVLLLISLGCASTPYKPYPDDVEKKPAPDMHPGHPGHEMH